MSTSKIQAIILSVVVLVAFLAGLPTIISSTVTAAGTTGIITATAVIINLILFLIEYMNMISGISIVK